ncbi:MAG TPA: TolC family protein [Candidatus Acidoferrales bacterium]|nr:TolC family protein [Candidatus Acidoferrales bacterium]
MLKGLMAPGSSERPWRPPDMMGFAEVIKARVQPEADPQKNYDLADLIDLAERANPETKFAWEQAKQAAAAVGLAQSEYFPILALNASAGYSREPVPVPESATTAGYLDLKTEQAQPVATLEWVLLDFGRRKSSVVAAKNHLLAANFGFNARHQEIIFNVQSAFYEYCKARGRIDVAQSALTSALEVQQAVEERFKYGLATAPDVSQAQQQAASATFDLEDVQAKERDTQVVLAETIGITPTVPLHVVDFSKLPVPTNLEDTVEQVIDRTLKQRPDLMAQVALLSEKEAEVRHARTAYYPTLAFVGEAGWSFDNSQMKFAGNELPWSSTQQPVWGAGLSLTWSLFDGGSRKHKLELAEAEHAAAQHALENSSDEAISQVWQSYTDTKLAISRLDVATALVDASEKSYQQTFEAYQNGLSSLVDVLSARRELSQARYTQLDTRATLLESTAALAFASGDLGRQLLERKPWRPEN